MSRIALIAPFPKLAELGEEVCIELDEELDIMVGDMLEGVKNAQNSIKKGAQAIISRGGTAIAIRETVNVPVIEIAVTGYDLMRAIIAARKISDSIGVVGYKNIVYGVAAIREIMGINLKEYMINSDEDMDDVITQISGEGIEIVVGDVIAVRKASQKGLLTVLVHSGREAISQAISEARKTVEIINNEREKIDEFNTLINFVHEGIITLDVVGKINLVNPVAEKILKMKAEDLVGYYARDVIPGLMSDDILETKQPLIGEVCYIQSGLIVKDLVPILSKGKIVGVIATIQEANRIQKAEEKVRRELYLKGNTARYTFFDMHTINDNMKGLIEQAKKYSLTNSTILIDGETGTGKEVLAQSIHNYSLRKNEPFVAINCAAVPETLLESELFGYEEGSFTGALKGGKPGLFEIAHHGTLFLDEIGEMPLNLQARLLRILQEKVVRRIGSDKVIPLDVRIIAATNKNLLSEVRKENFREDLYYRLNILSLYLPPLRDRVEDIKYLSKLFIAYATEKTGCRVNNIEDDAIEGLKLYSWPGNVRELENVIERYVILKNDSRITLQDLSWLDVHKSNIIQYKNKYDISVMSKTEKELILQVLDANKWNIKKTSEILNISRTTLWRKMNKYCIKNET